MRTIQSRLISMLVLSLFATAVSVPAFAAKKEKEKAAPGSAGLSITALDRYVAAPDPNFTWW